MDSKSVAQMKVGVLGAGVVGLSTALALLQKFPTAEVTVLADKFLSETLSSGAGGFFRPEVNIGPDRETIKKWAQVSYDHYASLAKSDSARSGNMFVSGYQLSSYSATSVRNELIESIVPSSVRPLTDSEMLLFPNKFQHGIFWTSIITDPRYYLPYLQDQITEKGGKIEKYHVDSFDQLAESFDFDIVLNCTGLEAAKLTDDFKLTPVRGQTIKVKAPWVKHFYFADGAYILPGCDYVTLGGIKDYGNGNTNLSELDRNSIWSRCTELVPSLLSSTVESEWVGLRPNRQPVRVEYEEIALKSGHSMHVVHNYGHGGHGVTLSWGTAQHACSLVESVVKGRDAK